MDNDEGMRKMPNSLLSPIRAQLVVADSVQTQQENITELAEMDEPDHLTKLIAKSQSMQI